MQRELVENKKWLTEEEFVEDFGCCPNTCRWQRRQSGLDDRRTLLRVKGAMVALAGMLTAPMLVALVLAALYAGVAENLVVQGALRGMGAVAAGLITATGIKMIGALGKNPMGMTVCVGLAVITFAAIALVRIPLATLLLTLGILSCLWAYRKLGDGTGQTMSTTITMTAADWLSMLVHFMSLSLLAVGGAITTAPDIHRRLVDETHWLTESQLTHPSPLPRRPLGQISCSSRSWDGTSGSMRRADLAPVCTHCGSPCWAS